MYCHSSELGTTVPRYSMAAQLLSSWQEKLKG